ncbi:hypothetical protein FIBSPDRAFT_76456 [Athelia psychrophila]|uniref:Uncharacterized protein n=1 Tax=Athelia psychrophila TaxID=1759441 RepID=A0A166EFH1_9AGAM|nr:hypothetical protein FIBSPDRAFT_76456 [Fibularhizoctonia sp. CBS 109695]
MFLQIEVGVAGAICHIILELDIREGNAQVQRPALHQKLSCTWAKSAGSWLPSCPRPTCPCRESCQNLIIASIREYLCLSSCLKNIPDSLYIKIRDSTASFGCVFCS